MEKFSESGRNSLLSNKYVSSVTQTHVTFTPNFKIKAVELNLKGKSPTDIFLSLGIDPSFFVPSYPKKSISKGRPRRKYDPDDIA